MSVGPTFAAASAETSKTREALGLRLGEMVDQILGEDRVRQLFDAAGGNHPAEYNGQATGEVAVKLGMITPETKTALLVAQAAERTYRLAEKAGALAADSQNLIAKQQPIGTDDVVTADNPVFKFVGSERDPDILRRAQGTWMAAQMLLNNEIDTVNDSISNPQWLAKPISEGVESPEGFKTAAIGLYKDAATMLAAAGHADAAKKLEAVSQSLAPGKGNTRTPSEAMHRLAQAEVMLDQVQAVATNSDYSKPSPLELVYRKLEALTAPKAAAASQLRPASPAA